MLNEDVTVIANETEEGKEVLKFTPQPQRDLLERYFAEKILSLKHGLDEVYEPKANIEGETLTRLQSLKAYWNICRTEIEEIVQLFGDVNPATMHPNHRKIMVITKHYLQLLRNNDIINEDNEDNTNCLSFATDAIQYLGLIHLCLSNSKEITEKNKNEAVKQFLKKEQLNVEQKSKRKRTTKAKSA